MVNVEADVLCGPLLAERARRQGVVYSMAPAIGWPVASMMHSISSQAASAPASSVMQVRPVFTAIQAIDARKHVVMVNVEADVLCGPLLAERARRQGVPHTVSGVE
jgi:predicted homoserine dehydrogenase-like protein